MKNRYPVFIALLCTSLLAAPAPESKSTSSTQTGRLATVHLLATARVSSKSTPDGMRFLFLVTRTPDVTGQFTLKETRDFLLAGESYQQKTEAELGKKFEPGTSFDNAENFFAKQPGMRRLAPDDIKGAYVLTIAIAGTKLPPNTKAEITLHVGFDKQVEPFTFQVAVPPARAPAKS